MDFFALLLLPAAVLLTCVFDSVTGGCCTSSFTLCSEELPQACKDLRDSEEQKVLVYCQEDSNPVTIQQCQHKCKSNANVGKNAVCISAAEEAAAAAKSAAVVVQNDSAPKKAPTTTTTATTTTIKTTTTTTLPPAPVATMPAAVSASGGTGNLDTSSPAVQQIILQQVNKFRMQRKAANMLKVIWDPATAKSAQAFADKCEFKITKETKNQKCGQTTAMGDGFNNWSDAFSAWMNQGNNFQFGQKPCFTAGKEYLSYTQLVWARSYQIGCAYSPCTTKGEKDPMFVCQYCPRGNINGNCQPYLEGTDQNGGVCGKCGGLGSSKCEDGLCNNPCPFENRYKECDDIITDLAMCTDPDPDPNIAGCKATCNCRASGLIY
ncbi:putative Cysteine-rich secretory protein 3 [Hypsibius exemplaris]|uniref:Cysteine-rich secretory protein 3 n=1 Tax=Hypsibius exemplaris TaxID=2072580 RepID=A0A1W0WNG4_HYPEX|nr:putative Cysteine-rich secretory protein 3 [Hypsibius exemplaris]